MLLPGELRRAGNGRLMDGGASCVTGDVKEPGQGETASLGRCHGFHVQRSGSLAWTWADSPAAIRSIRGVPALASALAEHHAPFRPGSRKGAAQLGQHRRIGFDRNDFGTQRDQRGGQLAGSGAEVEALAGRARARAPSPPRPGRSPAGAQRRRSPLPRTTTREVAVRPLPRGYSICQGKPRPDRIGKP